MLQYKKFILILICTFLNSNLYAKHLKNIRREGVRAFMIDYQSNTVLFAHDAETLMFPSSMQKCLLVSLAFDYLADKDPNQIFFRTSQRAYKQEGTRMFLKPGVPVSVEELLKGVIVVSGNDAAVVLAEGMFGSEDAAAEAMSNLAKEWGCKRTTVLNVTGLTNVMQMTTAYDLVLIGQALFKKYPHQWYRFAEKTFTHNKITQRSKNVALGLPGFHVDGIKSGLTEAAGYGLLFTAWQGDRRIFGVVNGCQSREELKEFVVQMLAFGFGNFENIRLCAESEVVAQQIPTLLSDRPFAEAVSLQDFYITVQKYDLPKMRFEVRYTPIKGKCAKGTHVADIYAIWPSGKTVIHPLFLKEDLGHIAFWKRPWAILKYWWSKL